MRAINALIVHCAATRPEWMADKPIEAKYDEIRRWHLARGFNDIGYHALIDRDGALIHGRRIETVGAHVRGHNSRSIGVCLIGGHGSSANDQFSDHFTDAQDECLRAYIAQMLGRLPKIRLPRGHNEFAAKACPGFQVADWYGFGVLEAYYQRAMAWKDGHSVDRGWSGRRASPCSRRPRWPDSDVGGLDG